MNSVPEELYDGLILDWRIDFCKMNTLDTPSLQMRRFYNVVNLFQNQQCAEVEEPAKMPTERLNSAGNDMLSWRELKTVVQKLSILPVGMLVHNCTLNSCKLLVSQAISCWGTMASRTALATRVLLSESAEYSKDCMITCTTQFITLNRKNARDSLLRVIRRYWREKGKINGRGIR